MTFEALAKRLNEEAHKRNHIDEISADRPDPLLIASRHNDEFIALICALFAYGNVSSIIQSRSLEEYFLKITEGK